MGNVLSNEQKAGTRVPKHLLPTKVRQSKSKKKPEATQSDTVHRTKSPKENIKHLAFTWSYDEKPFSIESGDYYLSNDQPEQDRHRFELYVLRWAFSSRHLIPPASKAKLFEGIDVLEVNCGPGLWDGHPILDMAHDFVHSRFQLLDTCNLVDPRVEGSGSESRLRRQHPNFEFVNHNIQQSKRLPFEDNTFDLIQQRFLMFIYKESEWQEVLKEFKRILKPGGYVQLLEAEFPPQSLGPQGQAWMDQIRQVLQEKMAVDGTVGSRLDRLLSEAGFRDNQTRFVSIPMGTWGLDIGHLWKQNYESFFDSAEPFMAELLALKPDQYRTHVGAMMAELDQYKTFSNIYHTWGCK